MFSSCELVCALPSTPALQYFFERATNALHLSRQNLHNHLIITCPYLRYEFSTFPTCSNICSACPSKLVPSSTAGHLSETAAVCDAKRSGMDLGFAVSSTINSYLDMEVSLVQYCYCVGGHSFLPCIVTWGLFEAQRQGHTV